MKRSVSLTAFIGAVLFLAVPAALAQDRAEEAVKQTVTKFMDAVKAKDIDAIMKLVAVPWYHDGKEVTRDLDKLKDHFKEIERKDFTGLTFQINDVFTYPKFLDAHGARLKEEDRKLLEQVVGKEDYVVLVTVEVKDKKDRVMLLVRSRKGETKLIGLRD